MARAKARELDANLHRAAPYVATDMRGRVRHEVIWRRALVRWKPGLRVFVQPAASGCGVPPAQKVK